MKVTALSVAEATVTRLVGVYRRAALADPAAPATLFAFRSLKQAVIRMREYRAAAQARR